MLYSKYSFMSKSLRNKEAEYDGQQAETSGKATPRPDENINIGQSCKTPDEAHANTFFTVSNICASAL